MGKALYIAEKPSVAREFAKALKENMKNHDGYTESDHAVVTWCVGHLVTMSYPEVYDEKYRRWRLDTLPFLPKEFKYEVIESSAKQFKIVAGLLNRPDVDVIYVCTDSGREGEYIYRLVEQMAQVKGKERAGCGLIPRRRKRFSGESGRRRICPLTTIWRTPPTCGPRKII